MESNTTNMDVASNPPNHPSDIKNSHISETQMTPPSDDDQNNDTELNSGN